MKREIAGAVLGAGLFLGLVQTAGAAVPASGELHFTVMREGDEIGTHEIEFEQKSGALEVEIETDVAVKVLGIALYRFEHEGHEVWRDGQLVQLNSKTNDDGKAHHLAVRLEDGKLVVEGDGRQGPEEPGVIPASLWNEELVKQSALLNTLDGSHMPVTVTRVGAEIVEAGGRNVSATHYSVTGQLNRELWYDANGVLVQVQFAGSDGSQISYILQ
jgi:hypothetical protein